MTLKNTPSGNIAIYVFQTQVYLWPLPQCELLVSLGVSVLDACVGGMRLGSDAFEWTSYPTGMPARPHGAPRPADARLLVRGVPR